MWWVCLVTFGLTCLSFAATLTISREVQSISHEFPFEELGSGYESYGADYLTTDTTGFDATLADYDTYAFRFFAPAGMKFVINSPRIALYVMAYACQDFYSTYDMWAQDPVTITFENLVGYPGSPSGEIMSLETYDSGTFPNADGLGVGVYTEGAEIKGPLEFTAVTYQYTRTYDMPSVPGHFEFSDHLIYLCPSTSGTDPGQLTRLVPVPVPRTLLHPHPSFRSCGDWRDGSSEKEVGPLSATCA